MELLTVKEVAKKLKVNPTCVYALMKAGHLNYLVLGSKKVTDFELQRFLKEAQGKDFTDLNNVKNLEV
ncbi:helix-turn-helix domain-containing protein [Clostridium perfringens]|uniref:helix-turn-helix domain-containing protein n=1 Tax=Clostridium perfringens TaxID=1502 RepID=UPI002ED3AFDC|nr:helix-turn-helix domain-containing protein [Clostridium perfringens]WVM60027.1 helix-turn-helix domain-containing protein [Clostridium perfringens]